MLLSYEEILKRIINLVKTDTIFGSILSRRFDVMDNFKNAFKDVKDFKIKNEIRKNALKVITPEHKEFLDEKEDNFDTNIMEKMSDNAKNDDLVKAGLFK